MERAKYANSFSVFLQIHAQFIPNYFFILSIAPSTTALPCCKSAGIFGTTIFLLKRQQIFRDPEKTFHIKEHFQTRILNLQSP